MDQQKIDNKNDFFFDEKIGFDNIYGGVERIICLDCKCFSLFLDATSSGISAIGGLGATYRRIPSSSGLGVSSELTARMLATVNNVDKIQCIA